MVLKRKIIKGLNYLKLRRLIMDFGKTILTYEINKKKCNLEFDLLAGASDQAVTINASIPSFTSRSEFQPLMQYLTQSAVIIWTPVFSAMIPMCFYCEAKI